MFKLATAALVALVASKASETEEPEGDDEVDLIARHDGPAFTMTDGTVLYEGERKNRIWPLKDCQPFLGAQVFNIGAIDSKMRDKSKSQAALKEFGTGQWFGKFQFKICQTDFGLMEGGDKNIAGGLAIGTCNVKDKPKESVKATAFYGGTADCHDQFNLPLLRGLQAEEKGGAKPKDATTTPELGHTFKGFSLTWETKEVSRYCVDSAGAKQKLQVKLYGICDPKAKNLGKDDAFKWNTEGAVAGKNVHTFPATGNKCIREFSFVGHEACSYDLVALLAPLVKFSGAIEIVGGLILTFIGGKSVTFAATILAGVITAGLIFGLAANFGVMDTMLNGSIGVVIGVAVAAVIVGAIASFLVWKFLKNWFIMVIGAVVGAILVVVLTSPISAIPNIVKIILAIVGMCLGGYLGKKLSNIVASAGTAILGAFFLFHGLSSFIGGFPAIYGGGKVQKPSLDPAFFGYVGGMIVFAIAGTFVQLKFFPIKDDVDKDDMMKADNS